MIEPIHAFMDESGVHGGSPVVAVAMYAAQQHDWRAFAHDWNAAKHPINVFHAVDCANRTGEFTGWDRKQRDALATKLAPVLASHNIIGVAVGIHLGAFMQD
jgi:hypothetical protein